MLSSADWADLTPRLLAVAQYRLSQYGRTVGRHGTTPDQFVMRAVMDVLEGKYEPVFIRSLFSVIAPRIAILVHLDHDHHDHDTM
jgi:hypothetical protein